MDPDEYNCDEFDKLATELSLVEDLKDLCSEEVLRGLGVDPDEYKECYDIADDPGRQSLTTGETSSTSVVLRSSPRFKRQITEEEIDEAISNRVPKNTKKSIRWGMSVWEAWHDERGIEKDILEMSCEELDRYVARFVQEAVKRDGKGEYPPNSLYQITVAIQRYLRENGRPEISFFDENNAEFATLRRSLDARMKELTAAGFGTQVDRADPVTPDMEAVFWEKGIFGKSTSEGLLNTVYYYNCKLFGLRAGDEHRNLDAEQYKFSSDEQGEYIMFTGRSSKSYQGGLKHRKIAAKELKIYSIPQLGERDVVQCYKMYLNCIPSKGPFYRRPVRSEVGSLKAVVGKNWLGNILKKICEKAGFSGRFTGHSGKVTCATELYKHDIDEQLIQLQTGHRSDAVRVYKRPGNAHYYRVSEILQPPLPKPGKSAVDKQEKIHSPLKAMQHPHEQPLPTQARSPLKPVQLPSLKPVQPSPEQVVAEMTPSVIPSMQSTLPFKLPGGINAAYGNVTVNFNFGAQ